MDALILSCATGGGHNTAAEAMKEELKSRGHHVTFMDPYTLFGRDLDKKVGQCYVRVAQKAPKFFGFIYKIGDLYRRLPVKSPVFWANKRAADRMKAYLDQNSYDVILTTHLFPGEILTHLRLRGVALPKIIYISTDYTCIPFVEEIDCDYFIVPSRKHKEESCAWGIPEEKVIPIGIPVKKRFREKLDREKTMRQLGLDAEKRYILVSGGSIGAGELYKSIRVLYDFLKKYENIRILVICGNNRQLYKKMKKKYGEEPQICLIRSTKRMAEYLKVCDVYISKPGGLSSTEAAAANIPLIHITPIPGCESKNIEYFTSLGMSLGVMKPEELVPALKKFQDADFVNNMKKAQRDQINANAACEIADFIEEKVSGNCQD